jgi:hypothetical protein
MFFRKYNASGLSGLGQIAGEYYWEFLPSLASRQGAGVHGQSWAE